MIFVSSVINESTKDFRAMLPAMAIEAMPHEIIYDIVSADDNILNIKELCQITDVSRSGYYAWVNAESKHIEHNLKDPKDFDLILTSFQ